MSQNRQPNQSKRRLADRCSEVSLLFFRSHVHRDLKLQTCCVRLQRNATLNQSNRAARGPRCSFQKQSEEKFPDRKANGLNCGFISFLYWYRDAGTGTISSVGEQTFTEPSIHPREGKSRNYFSGIINILASKPINNWQKAFNGWWLIQHWMAF